MPEDSDTDLANQIGRRLQATRSALELTQAEVATRLGVPQPSYNHWETGRRMLPPRWAIRMCLEFRVTMDWLYLGDASGLPYRLHDAIAAKRSDADC